MNNEVIFLNHNIFIIIQQNDTAYNAAKEKFKGTVLHIYHLKMLSEKEGAFPRSFLGIVWTNPCQESHCNVFTSQDTRVLLYAN